ncbi:HlyD family secretion protein [Xylophilus sp. Leaf220]|uniref:HlyD family secretion protein n=1 Tax=Xylophilus sp. Leaf220 TaxID=1735686 RepID=UPI001F16DEB7|nr:HlyD family secretion protein [Xylophilus sp. Leaf220]
MPAGTPPQEPEDHTRLEEPAEAPADQAAAAHDDMPVEAAAPAPVPPPPPASPVAAPAPVAAAPTGWAPPRAGLTGTVATIVLALAGVLVVLYAWRLPPFTTALQSTDNAYVRGQTTIVSPQTSGYVAEVPVQDFQTVEAGQVLVRIDDRIYRQRVEQAQATLAGQIAALDNSAQTRRSREATVASQVAAVGNARAQLARARADLQRVDALVADGSVSLRERDQTVAALRQAEAAVEQAHAAGEIARQDVRAVTVGRAGLEAGVEGARAALALAEIDLANTVVRAPRAGQLSEVGVRAGQYVTAGTQLMFLVPARLWIIANYKEAQTAAMAPGQPVRFRVDALDRAELTGRVEQLAPAAGSEFAVLKADNATGNFVKVAQRIAVRIAIDPGQPLAARLRPGMSVETMVDTAGGPRTAPAPANGSAAEPGASAGTPGTGAAPPPAAVPASGAAR